MVKRPLTLTTSIPNGHSTAAVPRLKTRCHRVGMGLKASREEMDIDVRQSSYSAAFQAPLVWYCSPFQRCNRQVTCP